MHIDHVLIAVSDLTAAAADFEARYGLASVEGGRHPGWGTENRIVPLGDSYLELVAVVDEGEAAASVFGRWVAAGAAPAGRLLGWAVRTDGLDAVARRLDLTPRSGSRVGRGGKPLSWRSAGFEEAARDPSLPFFIEWAPGATLPGHSVALQQGAITGLTLRGDPHRLSSWLGDHTLPISVEPGAPAVTGLTITPPGRRIVIGSDRL